MGVNRYFGVFEHSLTPALPHTPQGSRGALLYLPNCSCPCWDREKNRKSLVSGGGSGGGGGRGGGGLYDFFPVGESRPYWYLVWPPCASTTAFILFGFDAYSSWRYS